MDGQRLMEAKDCERNQMPRRVSLFGLPLDIGVTEQEALTRFQSRPCLFTYLNPYAWKIARDHHSYVSSLARFDLVVCDGIGVQKAVKAAFGCTTPILSLDYSGMGHTYLAFAARNLLPLCLVGSTAVVVNRAAGELKKQFPDLKRIDAFSGYGDDPIKARDTILQSEAGMVLVGMGMGRQEAFLLDLFDSGWRGIGICVGGFFDKLENPRLHYPAWSEKSGLRFLGRLIREPRRLSKRYFIEYQPFIRLYLRQIIRGNSS